MSEVPPYAHRNPGHFVRTHKVLGLPVGVRRRQTRTDVYRAYSMRRSHKFRSRTANFDVDLNYLRSAHCFFVDLNTAKTF